METEHRAGMREIRDSNGAPSLHRLLIITDSANKVFNELTVSYPQPKTNVAYRTMKTVYDKPILMRAARLKLKDKRKLYHSQLMNGKWRLSAVGHTHAAVHRNDIMIVAGYMMKLLSIECIE